jgi:CRISPR-associated protein Cmr4
MTEPKPYFLFTRTPLHIGAGQSVGYVDLPIQREPHTRIPIVPGSSLKGVLRDREEFDDATKAWLFGVGAGEGSGSAGAILVGEARVLCFPVRSAKGSFAWLTCPLALARYARDTRTKNGEKQDLLTTLNGLTETPRNGSVMVLAGAEITLDGGQVVLEEYTYTALKETGSEADKKHAKEFLSAFKDWESHLAALAGLKDDPVWQLLPGRLAIVPDGIFSFYVQSACEIAQHVKIDDDTGTAADKALFNQENCPSETLFHGVIAAQNIKPLGEIEPRRAEQALMKLRDLDTKSLQIGGDETTGLGWCSFLFAHQSESEP